MHTVGVIGDGKTTRRNVKALLDDFHAEHTIDVLYAPGPEEQFSDAVRFAVDWAEANGVDFGIFMEEGQNVTHLDDYDLAAHGATDDVEEQAGPAILSNSTDIFLAWNSADDALYERTAEKALAAGKKVYDLVDGLFPITEGSDEEGAESDSAADPVAATEEATEPVESPEEPVRPADEAQAIEGEEMSLNVALTQENLDYIAMAVLKEILKTVGQSLIVGAGIL